MNNFNCLFPAAVTVGFSRCVSDFGTRKAGSRRAKKREANRLQRRAFKAALKKGDEVVGLPRRERD